MSANFKNAWLVSRFPWNSYSLIRCVPFKVNFLHCDVIKIIINRKLICDICSCEKWNVIAMQNLKKTPFLFLCFIIIVAHIKITIKITVQSSNSNPVVTDDTNITTILTFLNCTTGVWMIVDTGESTDDLLVEVITTSMRIIRKWAFQTQQH